VPDGQVDAEHLTTIQGISGVLWWGDDTQARAYAQAMARRTGAILPLLTGLPDQGYVRSERHVCVDTTAAGGNTALFGGL
jgi:RHH-type proline utilization regulon transcriptional repressor/proline dehydrogenase/delta 1-pyrroline-5-carboxylate dehydrogenase